MHNLMNRSELLCFISLNKELANLYMGRALLKPQKETYLNDSTGKRCCKNNPVKILFSGNFQKYQQTQGLFYSCS